MASGDGLWSGTIRVQRNIPIRIVSGD